MTKVGERVRLDADVEEFYLIRTKNTESSDYVNYTDELWAVVEIEGQEETFDIMIARYNTSRPKEKVND